MTVGKVVRICQESYGSSGTPTVYYTAADINDDSVVAKKNPSKRAWSSVPTQIFKSIFLPQGYPESVSQDYLHYQLWDSFQAFISTLMGTLSTQAVLKSIGVGDQSATPLAATITWILRDGTSMLGSIVFAWKQGSALDYDSKQWRLFADFVNDVAIGFDLVAAHVGSLNTAIVCISGVCRALVGVAGGATRAAFVQHQARRANLADVAAKDGSQETLVNLLGLVVGLAILPTISGNDALIWFLYCLFCSLHLLANYKAVRAIVMDTLNQSRLHVLADSFLAGSGGPLPNLSQTNLGEPVVIGGTFGKIRLGCSFRELTTSCREARVLQTLYSGSTYMLNIDVKTSAIFIILHKDSDERAMLESSFQAHVLLCHLQTKSKTAAKHSSELNDSQLQNEKRDLLSWSRTVTRAKFVSFLKALEAGGWQTGNNLLGADEWRAVWKYEAI